MAGASIRIDHNAPELAAGFERLARYAGDLSPAMRRISGHMLFATQRRFEKQSGPGGVAWSPLKPATIARNPRRAPPAPILRDTNRLYTSLTTASDATSAEAGTNVVYAGIHQFGGTIRRAAAKRTAKFRIAPEGAARTSDGRRVGSKLRFASARSRAKSLHERTFEVPEHAFTMTARPFLGFDADDITEFLAILGEETAKAAGASGASGGSAP